MTATAVFPLPGEAQMMETPGASSCSRAEYSSPGEKRLIARGPRMMASARRACGTSPSSFGR